MFINPFVFYGRIRRKEYALSLLIFGILLLITGVQGGDDRHSFYYILFLPIFWFRFAQGAKRCHDLGSSGWWQLIPFYNIWLIFADGETGRNQYGDNPKEDQYPNYPENFQKNQLDSDKINTPPARK